MPRRIINQAIAPGPPRELVAALAEEIRSGRAFGQPMIDEEHFPRTGSVYVRVFWDRWADVPEEDRAGVIFRAYEEAAPDLADKVGLAVGLTVPEAREEGYLPYHVTPALRAGDPVALAECHDAMRAVGASVLADPDRPQLVFPSEEQARACCAELIRRLPGSDPVWHVRLEVNRRTLGTVSEMMMERADGKK